MAILLLLLSGVIGALLVFVLGVVREWWRDEQERRGMLLLLRAEIEHNAEIISTISDRMNAEQAVEDLLGHPHFATQKTRTWDNVQERAAALSPDDLMAALDDYYAPLETLLTLVRFPNMVSDSFDRTLRGQIQEARPEWSVAATRQPYREQLQKLLDAQEATPQKIAQYLARLHAPDVAHMHNNKGNALGGRGDLLTRLARTEEAEEAYADAVVAYDKALNHAPDYTYAYNNKAHALARRGELLAILSRHEEAEKAFSDGAEAFDETLSRAPGGFGAHYHKAMALFAWGVSMRSFVPDEVTRDRWEAAQTHCEHALTLAPQPEQAEQLLASIILHLDSLDADTSQE